MSRYLRVLAPTLVTLFATACVEPSRGPPSDGGDMQPPGPACGADIDCPIKSICRAGQCEVAGPEAMPDPTEETEGDAIDPMAAEAVGEAIRERLAEQEWPEGGGAVRHRLPFADGVHMGITQGTRCGGHASLAGAIDFNIAGGTYESSNGLEVVASEQGTVLKTSCGAGYGTCVVIRHIDGTQSLYAHMIAGSLAVERDQQVCRGQVLGLIGSTGNSTGDHLHYEQRNAQGNIVDPVFVDGFPEGVPTGCNPCQTRTHLDGCYESHNALLCAADIPAPPRLVEPADGADLLEGTIRLGFERSSGEHILKVRRDPPDGEVIYEAPANSNTVNLDLPPALYRWTVYVPHDGCVGGQCAAPARVFTVRARPMEEPCPDDSCDDGCIDDNALRIGAVCLDGMCAGGMVVDCPHGCDPNSGTCQGCEAPLDERFCRDGAVWVRNDCGESAWVTDCANGCSAGECVECGQATVECRGDERWEVDACQSRRLGECVTGCRNGRCLDPDPVCDPAPFCVEGDPVTRLPEDGEHVHPGGLVLRLAVLDIDGCDRLSLRATKRDPGDLGPGTYHLRVGTCRDVGAIRATRSLQAASSYIDFTTDFRGPNGDLKEFCVTKEAAVENPQGAHRAWWYSNFANVERDDARGCD